MRPWSERYRPTTLSDIEGHYTIIDILQSFIKKGNFPHILLHGPQGTGKTATARAFLKDFYGKSFRYNVNEHNSSSEDRGINFIRGQLVKECQSQAKEGYKFKTIFLSEIDGLTPDAQFALRRTMEIHSRNVRFIADCNDIHKVIKPIRSRFAEYYVGPVSDGAISAILTKIVLAEDFLIELPILRHIRKIAAGDTRSAINMLQSISHLDKPSLDDIKAISPFPSKESIDELLEINKNGSTFEAREQVLKEVIRESGNRTDEILHLIYDHYYEFYEGDMKAQLLYEIGDFLNRMATLHVPHIIQLRSCLERIRQIEGIK